MILAMFHCRLRPSLRCQAHYANRTGLPPAFVCVRGLPASPCRQKGKAAEE